MKKNYEAILCNKTITGTQKLHLQKVGKQIRNREGESIVELIMF